MAGQHLLCRYSCKLFTSASSTVHLFMHQRKRDCSQGMESLHQQQTALVT